MSMIGRLCAAAAIAAMLLLAGCGGDATHFYTLVRPTAPSTAGTASFAIDVQSVRLPLQVDQPELVIRQGDGAVALVETRRWIAPLPDEVRSARADIRARRVAGVYHPDEGTLGPGAPHATSRCAQVRSPLGRQPGRGGAGVSKGVGGTPKSKRSAQREVPLLGRTRQDAPARPCPQRPPPRPGRSITSPRHNEKRPRDRSRRRLSG